uniref:Tyrosine-protein kinase n=1 Tax=Ceratitis capitata TaxID=7213 RepID=W8BSA2_CERCA
MSRTYEFGINWFHPGLSRETAEKLLLNECTEDGSFLIRECNSAVGDFVLTLLHQNNVCHYQIRRHGGDAFFSIDDKVKILHGLESLVEFYQMASNGLPTKLTTFVKKDLPPNDARRHGSTNLLHRATKENNATIVGELLKCGYRNVDAKNQDGQTALHLAAIHSDDVILKLILATDVNVNCMDAFGNMPLHYACRTKPDFFIRNLIDAKANVQGRNIKNGYVPLHEASKHGNLEAVKVLLESNAPLLPRTTSGEFPIDLAREAGQDAVVDFLSEFKLPAAKTKRSLWYHGTLTREEAVDSLQRFMRNANLSLKEKDKDREISSDNEVAKEESPVDSSGCFLIRYSDRSGYVLTLLFEGQVKNFIISRSSKYFYIDEGPFLPTLEHLVEHFMHFNDGLPINLKYAVPPEPKPPQPLLSTLPRNKSHNKKLNNTNVTIDNTGVAETVPTALVSKKIKSNAKSPPEKKRKDTANVILSNFLKIKLKDPANSDEKPTSTVEPGISQRMIEEFPCKGLSFSSNFSELSVEKLKLDANSADVNKVSALNEMYNVPKNNTAVPTHDGSETVLSYQGTKYQDKDIGPDDSYTNRPNRGENEIPNTDDDHSKLNNKIISDSFEGLHINNTPKNMRENACFDTSSISSPQSDIFNYFSVDVANYYIPYDNIELGELIGEGEFGSVYRGRLKEYNPGINDNFQEEIAIKTLRDEHCHYSKDDFLREASVMIRLKHHCIVQLIGLSKADTLMMIQEMVPLGSMLNFIQNNRERIDPNRELKLWASQIAYGMQYLESQHFVHRDLAARNILLASCHQAKISDFGLSRALGSDKDFYEAQHGGRWPIKWYAPESYKIGIFSHSSDVWSYGVTLWEMFSLGETPYGDMLGSEAVNLIEDGKRLSQPTYCPDNVYSIMENCWQYNPKDRPTFNFLTEFFIKDPDYQNIIELVKSKSIR